jgi:Predicted ATPase
MADERSALAGLRLDYTQGPDHVWQRSPYHVDTLHSRTAGLLISGIEEARDIRLGSPIGVVVKGARGTGKTHLLGWAREQVQQRDGYFFLVGLLDARSFWDSVAVSVLQGLSRRREDGRTQLETFLLRLSSQVEMPAEVQAAALGKAPITREALDVFIQAVAAIDRELIRTCRDTLRALVLRASSDFNAQDIAEAYLTCGAEEVPGEWAQWGIRQVTKSTQEFVQEISYLLALTGPIVIAVDQIDMLVAQYGIRSEHAEQDWRGTLLIEHVAHGLMSLREYTRRTLTIVSCLPDTWELIVRHATDTVQDRFRTAVQLGVLPDAETAAQLVERRFAAKYESIGYTPPYPTWPIKPSVFAEAVNRTPRALLKQIDDHIRSCLLSGEIREMESLAGSAPDQGQRPTGVPGRVERAWLALDERFASLRAAADVTGATNPATEDATMPKLLAAGLEAWVAALGEAGNDFSQDPEPGTNPPLHARLRRNLDDSTEDQVHWAFRAIAATNARAVMTRLRKAAVEAGLAADVPKRRLFILRNAPWPSGPKTREVVTRFMAEGGRVLTYAEDDLKILAALRDLIAENPPHLRSWFASRNPAQHVGFLREALGSWTDPQPPAAAGPLPPPPPGKPQGGLGPVGRQALGEVGDLLSESQHAAQGADGAPPVRPIAIPPNSFAPTGDWRPSGLLDSSTGEPRLGGPRGPQLSDSAVPYGSPGGSAQPRTGGSFPSSTNGAASPYGNLPRLSDPAPSPPGHRADAQPGGSPGHQGGVRPPHASSAPASHLPTPHAADAAHSATSQGAAPAPAAAPTTPAEANAGPRVTVGTVLPSGPPVTVPLQALRKHVVIFAGSGSGKTVLIRRLVEECALHGVSAIVLDPNNDLARLGDPWPAPPPQWGPGDAARADEYLAGTDVVIWTPRRSMGRPLAFQPLPDFASVADHPDEFREAVDVAVATIAPRAKLGGNTGKAERGRAVLREAIAHYGRRGGGDLRGLIDLLTYLPEGVSSLDGAEKIAADISQTLTAAIVNDPLFGGEGTPVDPGILLTPPPGKRARISVINFIGLPEDDQRQSFVGQLQMALFAWIKKHPASDRPLGGLLVMDEAQTFAPAGATTPCTWSTLALATQARKYGLGLIFATQAPKSLHNRIPGNAATQFYGLLNSPVQIEAAREMARAKGGDVPDISRLTTGQFYVAPEGRRPTKVRTPLCLTHHPPSPLTTEEVIARANRS